MKNNTLFILITTILFFCGHVAYAAFPSKPATTVISATEQVTTVQAPAILRPAPTPAQNRANDAAIGFGIAAFACGVVGLFVAGIPLGVCAIVFGAIGMSKKLRGLAIAGIVLGVIDIIGALIVLGQQ